MKLRNKITGEIIDGYLKCKYYEDGGYDDMACESLEELFDEWEDYTPSEPLIKDEKIRKAVRAWAEINEASQARTIESCSGAYWYIRAFYIGERRCIDLDIRGEMPRELVSNKCYTIAELCGEEEE